MSTLHINEKNFDTEVTNSTVPVLVDFWAEWCGPCRMVGPILDEISAELSGQVKIVKVNVDESQDLAMKYNVMSIPTMIMFKNGEMVDQFVGAMPKAQILSKIKANL